MLQDGIVARFLAEHCPDPRFRLCDHRAEIPTDADEFFWGETIFDQLGRFEGLNDEMRTIVLESIKAYPLWQLEAALSASARQLVKVATGEGVVVDIWHTSGMIENFVPSALPGDARRAPAEGRTRFQVAQQAACAGRACLDGAAPPAPGLGLFRCHPFRRARSRAGGNPAWVVPTCAGTTGTSRSRSLPADLTPLAITVALAILGNAVVCGVFANPHDRYGARIVWLATFVVLIALIGLARPQRQRVDG